MKYNGWAMYNLWHHLANYTNKKKKSWPSDVSSFSRPHLNNGSTTGCLSRIELIKIKLNDGNYFNPFYDVDDYGSIWKF